MKTSFVCQHCGKLLLCGRRMEDENGTELQDVVYCLECEQRILRTCPFPWQWTGYCNGKCQPN